MGIDMAPSSASASGAAQLEALLSETFSERCSYPSASPCPSINLKCLHGVTRRSSSVLVWIAVSGLAAFVIGVTAQTESRMSYGRQGRGHLSAAVATTSSMGLLHMVGVISVAGCSGACLAHINRGGACGSTTSRPSSASRRIQQIIGQTPPELGSARFPSLLR